MRLMRPNNEAVRCAGSCGAGGAHGAKAFPVRRPTLDFSVCGQTWESSLPLPKHHSQTAQELVKKSTLNPGTGGSNEKAISRKRSARRVGLWSAGGIRCRKAGAGLCTSTAAASGLHLERLLCRCKRGYFERQQPALQK